MLQLTVNGEPQTLTKPEVLAQILTELGFGGQHFAVAVNGDFVPRHEYPSYQLKGGETLEVLSPMQGG